MPDVPLVIDRDAAQRIVELLAAGNRNEKAARDAREEAHRLKHTLYGISRGGLDVLQERLEQRTKFGHTYEPDDKMTQGELAAAAACYAIADLQQHLKAELPTIHDEVWPWTKDDWRKGSHRRNLVVASALLIAEIDRLDRLAEPK